MPLYAATIFVSAFLLFLVQPIVAKQILPWFGGSAAVWTTCVFFFQFLLLAGYAYAHAIVRWLPPRPQLIVHLLAAKPLWSHLGMELGASRLHHAAAGSGHPVGALALQRLNGGEQLRVRGVEQREASLTLRIPQSDSHSVGKGGNDHVSDGEQDLVRV